MTPALTQLALFVPTFAALQTEPLIGRETVIAITNPGEVQPGSCSDQRADIYLRYRILLLSFQKLDRQPSHRLGFANGSRLWRPCDVAQSR